MGQNKQIKELILKKDFELKEHFVLIIHTNLHVV